MVLVKVVVHKLDLKAPLVLGMTYMVFRVFDEHLSDEGFEDAVDPVFEVGSVFSLLHFNIF